MTNSNTPPKEPSKSSAKTTTLKPKTATQRALQNGAIFAFIIAVIGLYQGENILTATMVGLFAWVIIGGALWLSYKLTAPKASKNHENNNDKNHTNKQ